MASGENRIDEIYLLQETRYHHHNVLYDTSGVGAVKEGLQHFHAIVKGKLSTGIFLEFWD